MILSEKKTKQHSKSNTVPIAIESKTTLYRALVLLLVLLVLCLCSILYICKQKNADSPALYACIYQNGILIQTIDLSQVTESHSFTVVSADGGFNTIEVRNGSIGICDADCPDKLCVSMGYADSSLLPIVCLPHSLVIQIREKKGEYIDSVSY